MPGPGKDLVEVDAYTAKVHVPLTGEPVMATDLENASQSLANRAKNHETHGLWSTAKLAAGNALTYALASGGIIRLKSGALIDALSGGIVRLAVGSKIQSLGASGSHSVNLDGWFERNGMMYRSGNDARERRRSVVTSDADSDITVAFDTWKLPQATGNHTRTVRTTTPTDLQLGEQLLIVRTQSNQIVGAFTETIVSESGTTLFTFGLSGGANGINGFVLLEYGQTMGLQPSPDWFPIMAGTFVIGAAGSGWWSNA